MQEICTSCGLELGLPYCGIDYLLSEFMMNPLVLLTYYCLLILIASIAGGMIPIWFRLTHRGMELAVSFVAGVMLGVGLLHMLPHAFQQMRMARVEETASTAGDLEIMLWVLLGLLTMFFIERFFCFHHHDIEDGEVTCHHEKEHGGQHGHGHDISGLGAALGLTLHSIIAGVALAASGGHGSSGTPLAGLGAFLVILLHKPFDSMTIATLMARGGWPLGWRHLVNGLFALAIPVGAAFFYVGIVGETDGGVTLAKALAFASGTFLCISLSDLLPELQFHDHDRGKLSLALLLGLSLAYGICRLESTTHQHPPAAVSNVTDVVEAGGVFHDCEHVVIKSSVFDNDDDRPCVKQENCRNVRLTRIIFCHWDRKTLRGSIG